MRITRGGLLKSSDAAGAYESVKVITGVVGDNSTDDTAAIQAAITAAVTGDVLYLPKGQYKTTAALTVATAGITIRGAGRDSAVLRPTFRNSANSGGYFQVNASNVVIENLGVNGPGDGALTIGAVNIGPSTGAVNTITGVVVQRCHIQNISGHGVIGGKEASDCQVLDNLIETCGSTAGADGHGVCVEGSGWTVSRNRVKNCRMRGIEVFGSSGAGLVVSGGLVSDNVVTGCTKSGIALAGCSEVTVKGNISTGHGEYGIYGGLGQGQMTNIVVTHNICKSNTLDGIRMDAPITNLLLTGNECGSNVNGISVGTLGSGNAFAVTATGNICYRNSTYGIIFQNTKGAVVSGNVCDENGFGTANSGIGILLYLSNNTDFTIIGNRCSDRQGTKSQKYGLGLYAPFDFVTVVGNDLRGNADGTTDCNRNAPTTEGGLSIIGNLGRMGSNNTLTAPSVPSSTTALRNPFASDVTVYVSGGTVTVVAIDGVTTGLTTGAFRLAAGQTITLTYSVAPTWAWVPF